MPVSRETALNEDVIMNTLVVPLLAVTLAVVFYQTTLHLVGVMLALVALCIIFPGLFYLLLVPVAWFRKASCSPKGKRCPWLP